MVAPAEIRAIDYSADAFSRMAPGPAELLRRIVETGQGEGEPTPDAGGEIGKAEIDALYNLVRHLKPQATLEVGLAKGTSAITILAALVDAGIAVPVHRAIDPFQSVVYKRNGLRNAAHCGFGENLVLIEDSSHRALPYLLMSEKRRFDFVFLDGNHLFDFTFLEWFYCDKMLPVGGTILFDDADMPAVAAVINFLATNLPYEVVTISARLRLAIKTGEDGRLWSDFTPFATTTDR
ncbi:MAG: class I SAM-dependent methyltransferase [Rhodospirillales bacterium]|nr:class I SAM-dependent methyltransferase [Rhodospirillales bacterium]